MYCNQDPEGRKALGNHTKTRVVEQCAEREQLCAPREFPNEMDRLGKVLLSHRGFHYVRHSTF